MTLLSQMPRTLFRNGDKRQDIYSPRLRKRGWVGGHEFEDGTKTNQFLLLLFFPQTFQRVVKQLQSNLSHIVVTELTR